MLFLAVFTTRFKALVRKMYTRFHKFPKVLNFFYQFGQRYLAHFFMPLPRIMGHEERAVARVLRTPFWNMAYGSASGFVKPIHLNLEEEFASFVGTKFAVAVNTGGMAIQMTLRALGLNPGDEVIHQVDTCIANPFSVFNAGGVPIFADSDPSTFLLSKSSLLNAITEKTKIIMPIHLWGYSENLGMVQEIAKSNNLTIVEDCCLALGAEWGGRKVGSYGAAGVFSFGCMKPIQAGEGGMIVTNDEALAKELRTIRSWGDRTVEYGVRDQSTLSWNGRMSEIVAAVALEQLRAYPAHLRKIRYNVSLFAKHLDLREGLGMLSSNDLATPSYAQVILRYDGLLTGIPASEFLRAMTDLGVRVRHANFEPCVYTSFFSQNLWKKWVINNDIKEIANNYQLPFEQAKKIYNEVGIGIDISHFLSKSAVDSLIKKIDQALLRGR